MLVTAAERAKACVLSHHSLESSDCAHSSCDIYMYTDTYALAVALLTVALLTMAPPYYG
jgi:hypothetical protein